VERCQIIRMDSLELETSTGIIPAKISLMQDCIAPMNRPTARSLRELLGKRLSACNTHLICIAACTWKGISQANRKKKKEYADCIYVNILDSTQRIENKFMFFSR